MTASIVIRRHAWRAWAILAGWLVLADMISRPPGPDPRLRGDRRTGHPLRGRRGTGPGYLRGPGLPARSGGPNCDGEASGLQASQLATAVTAAVLGAFVLGSLVSVQAYQSVTTSVPARSFIANARVALKQAPAGTVIVDFPVPPTLLTAALFGRYGYASKVIGDMALGDHRVRWTRQPQGTINSLLAFGTDGRLRPVIWYGAMSPAIPAGSCWPARGRTVTVPLNFKVTNAKTVRIDYLASSAGVATVTFGGQSQPVTLARGLNSTYVPVHGSSNTVVISGPGLGSRPRLGPGKEQVCVGSAEGRAGFSIGFRSGDPCPPGIRLTVPGQPRPYGPTLWSRTASVAQASVVRPAWAPPRRSARAS